jgi:hypothetical protein
MAAFRARPTIQRRKEIILPFSFFRYEVANAA